jgi:lysyl-tRNA synthetase class 2
MPSTVIRAIHYQPEQRRMEIEFTTGRRYLYFEVPAEEVAAFRASGSRGRYFNARIRDRYRFTELSPAAVD